MLLEKWNGLFTRMIMILCLQPIRVLKSFWLLGVVGVAMCSVLEGGIKTVPGDVFSFFPHPNKPAEVPFVVDGTEVGDAVEYVVCDYQGKVIGSGMVAVSDGRIDVPIQVPQGYAEIQFPAFGQVFGLVALPDANVSPEGFWCIDAGLTWGKWRPEYKVEMVETLKEKGIASFRERLSWPEVDQNLEHPVTAYVRDSVYLDNIGTGQVLELFQDSPMAYRREPANPFSIDLGKGYRSWQRIAERYGPVWSALELWNEPFYVKGLSADQYVPVAKAVAAAVSPSQVVAGCFSPSIPAVYLEDCAEGGLLDVVDGLTLHFYGSPETMPSLMMFYHEFLQRHGHADLPLWVSESGDPETLEPNGRPSIDNERGSSMRTVMRAIACKAYGVRRFYAFYLQKHIEGVISWGMTDGSPSPQRRLAAYLYATQAVGDLPFVGEIDPLPSEVLLGYVFGAGGDVVVVLYAPDASSVRVPFEPRRVTGADGRELWINHDGTIPVPDGIVYLSLPRSNVEQFINAESPALAAVALEEGSRAPKVLRTLVVQPDYNPGQTAQISNLGHFVTAQAAAGYVAAAEVSNLSEQPQSVRVTLEVPGMELPSREIELGPYASKRVEWPVDLRSVLSPESRTPLVYRAQSDKDADSVTVYVQPQPATRIYQVQHGQRPPQIDGDPADACWAAAERISKLDCLDDSPYGGPADRDGLDGTARFLWSDVGLYFLIEVDDRVQESPESGALAWQRDSVQIAFYQENSAQDVNSFEWGFYQDGDGQAQKILFRSSGEESLSDSTRIAIRRDEETGRTTYEGVISWLDMGSMKAINDRTASRFRLSFIVNDANGGSRRWLEWSPGIAKSKSPGEYPELILVNEMASDGVRTASFGMEGWALAGASVQRTVFEGEAAFRIEDRKGAELSRHVGPLKMDRPVRLSFSLGVLDFEAKGGVSFCFKAMLWNDESNEGYECWIAPVGSIFSGKTGVALADHDGMLIKLGTDGAKLPPDGELHRVTLFIDPLTRILKLYLEKDGDNILVAEGVSKRNVSGINRLTFFTSGWGAGDLILSDVKLQW
jgi:hypothetical protein